MNLCRFDFTNEAVLSVLNRKNYSKTGWGIDWFRAMKFSLKTKAAVIHQPTEITFKIGVYLNYK
jgi:hypothetical protein